jgi:formylmethanofuran dehydrogenase subunit E
VEEYNTKVIKCKRCGKSIEVPVGKVGRPRIFCQDCADKRQRERERRHWQKKYLEKELELT